MGFFPLRAYPTQNCCKNPRTHQDHPQHGPEDPRGDLMKEEKVVKQGVRLDMES
jgi:hypothetical protein